MNQGIALRQVG